MVDVVLVVVLVVMALVIAGCSVLFLVKFSHPDDAGQARFPKAIVVFSFWLAGCTVLLLPFDVANVDSNVPVDVIWQVAYILIAIFCFALIPFAFFFYESDSDYSKEEGGGGACNNQIGQAFLYSALFLVAFIIIVIIMYSFLGTAEIPFKAMRQGLGTVHPIIGDAPIRLGRPGCIPPGCTSVQSYWSVPVTIAIYIVGVLSFLGWFSFTMFVGVGIVALPLDLINEFRTRPAPMKASEYAAEKLKLGERASMLLEAGEKLRAETKEGKKLTRKRRRERGREMRKFEQHFYFLKKDYEILNVSFHLKGGDPIWYVFKLIIGVIGLFLSISWILHILLVMIWRYPIHPFLNNMFVALSSFGFDLFGVIAYGIWTLYLLWCCCWGNLKLGLRFLFWRVYPMEVHKTTMNAFLFNTWLVLMCVVPLLQFCVAAFPIYARFTDVDMLLGTQVRYLQFFTYFWSTGAFIYAILVLALLTLILEIVRPVNKAKIVNQELADIAKNTSGKHTRTVFTTGTVAIMLQTLE